MSDISMWSHIVHASWVVQCVMLILLVASIFSWTIIFQRTVRLRAARHALDRFEGEFWSGGSLSVLYDNLRNTPSKCTDLALVFQSGFKEYCRLRNAQGVARRTLADGVARAMRVTRTRVFDELEDHLPVLATIGSVSPYVGLFGTVWGIMVSFQALSGAGQATIAMVAPGISEALVATAMGLFAAIPAVVAYNRFNHTVDRLYSYYESFEEEFINVLQHQTQAVETSEVVHG